MSRQLSSQSKVLERIASFAQCHSRHVISPYRLAHAGFHYVGPQDQVLCSVCNLVVSTWSRGDNPLARHLAASPHCAALSGLGADSVGLVAGPVVAVAAGPSPQYNVAVPRDGTTADDIKRLIEMGCSAEAIGRAIDNNTGRNFQSVHQLLDAVIADQATASTTAAAAGGVEDNTENEDMSEGSESEDGNDDIPLVCPVCSNVQYNGLIHLPCCRALCCTICIRRIHTCPDCQCGLKYEPR